jgi:hypothetical protein
MYRKFCAKKFKQMKGERVFWFIDYI